MAEDFAGWITKQEAAEQTGHSLRTLERLIQAQRIRQGYRRVPGRRPLTVLHPDDVERLKKETVPATPQVMPPAAGAPVLTPRSSLTGPATDLLNALATAVIPVQVALKDKLFLSLKEASAFSGLTLAHLRRLIADKKLKAFTDRGYKIRRRDLEKL